MFRTNPQHLIKQFLYMYQALCWKVESNKYSPCPLQLKCRPEIFRDASKITQLLSGEPGVEPKVYGTPSCTPVRHMSAAGTGWQSGICAARMKTHSLSCLLWGTHGHGSNMTGLPKTRSPCPLAKGDSFPFLPHHPALHAIRGQIKSLSEPQFPNLHTGLVRR